MIEYSQEQCFYSKLEKIENYEVNRPLLQRIWSNEKLGLFGYHGSTQQYRIYQDIIRYIFEEHLEIPIREDFHFLRVPGDPFYTYKTIKHCPNYKKEHYYRHFFCMNYTMHENIKYKYDCSYYYFNNNKSFRKIDHKMNLEWLFKKIGISNDQIATAFAIGEQHLKTNKGIILQLFDMSHLDPNKNCYALSDKVCGSFDSSLSQKSYTVLFQKIFQNKLECL